MQHHRPGGGLHCYVCRNAQRAIRVRDVPLRMRVDNLNRPADNHQRDAKQREQ
jgi:hypothetical protein